MRGLSTSIILFLLSDNSRSGMPLQSQRKKQAAKIGIETKSLDRDLGNKYIWPDSHYLMQECNDIGG